MMLAAPPYLFFRLFYNYKISDERVLGSIAAYISLAEGGYMPPLFKMLAS
jgi:hypothetical protein